MVGMNAQEMISEGCQRCCSKTAVCSVNCVHIFALRLCRTNCSSIQGLLFQATLPALYVVALVTYRAEKRFRSFEQVGHFTPMVRN